MSLVDTMAGTNRDTSSVEGVSVAALVTLIVTEGFISIAMEILAIRKLVPFAGANSETTSWVITLFLASLAAGLFKGGRVKGQYFDVLLVNLMIVQFFLVLGFSSYTLVALDEVIEGRLPYLLTFLVCVVCPATYFIGQTVPILSNYFHEETNGELSSKILSSSTVGSCLGSVGTAVVLMNYVGVSNTITVISALCSAVIWFFSARTCRYGVLAASAVLTLLSASVINNSHPVFVGEKTGVMLKVAGVFQDYENSYASATVLRHEGTGYLVQNNSSSSAFDVSAGKSPLKYVEYIEQRIRAASGQNILVVGAGGFTIGHSDQKNTYTFIDVDRDLQQLSESKLLQAPINGRFVVSGARPFLRSASPGSYDVIVSDAYSNKHSIPSSLVTVEYLRGLSRALADGKRCNQPILRSSHK